MSDSTHKPQGDEGFVLAAALVMVFLVLLALTIAAPRVAMAIKRDREVEAKHRGDQYVRGIRMYYKKFGHYPGSIEQLEKSNNQRFLRSRYLDPMTGKDDWRLIHVGENKTKVKGFFGEDLPGLGTGLGAASGMTGTGSGGTTGGSGSTSVFGGSTSTFGSSGSSGSAAGSSGGSGSSLPTSSSGTGVTGTNTGTGISSQNAGDVTGTGGPIMGVGSSKSGEAIVVVNEQTNYQDWEFIYDPRIEQLYAKGNLLGGVSSGSSTGTLSTTPIGGTPVTPAPTTPAPNSPQ